MGLVLSPSSVEQHWISLSSAPAFRMPVGIMDILLCYCRFSGAFVSSWFLSKQH